MRILFQAYGLNRGGGVANICELLDAFARVHPQDCLRVVCSEKAPLEHLRAHSNVEVQSLPHDALKEARRAWLNSVSVTRNARDFKADVVWSINVGPYTQLTVPHVISLHNAPQIYPWSEARLLVASPARIAALRWFFRLSLRSASGVIVQTPRMAECLRSLRDFIPIAVIPKPLGLQRITVRHPGLGADSRFTFLYVASLMPHKNHRVIIEAIDQLRRAQVPARLALTISEAELRSIAPELAGSLLERGAVLPLGWVEKADLAALYSAVDACVMPSLVESLSSAHLEAMACGLPQVCSDLPFARDICADAASYVPADDVSAWAGAMRELVENTVTRDRLTTAAQRQRERFPQSWEEAAASVRAFLQSCSSQNLREVSA